MIRLHIRNLNTNNVTCFEASEANAAANVQMFAQAVCMYGPYVPKFGTDNPHEGTQVTKTVEVTTQGIGELINEL